MTATVDFLVIVVISVVAIGLERQPCATDITLEAAMMKEGSAFQRPHFVRGVDGFRTAETVFLDHLEPGIMFYCPRSKGTIN